MQVTLQCPFCTHLGSGAELVPGFIIFKCSRCEEVVIFDGAGNGIKLPSQADPVAGPKTMLVVE